MSRDEVIAYVSNQAPGYGLDPAAVLAVASVEGLGGGVGDGGTSFGPWQLHAGGALPASVSLASAQDWAWSQAGVDYALGRIAACAGGQSGQSAVAYIVSCFERPADPTGEIARAIVHLGDFGGGSAPAEAGAGTAAGGGAGSDFGKLLALGGGALLGLFAAGQILDLAGAL